MAVKAQDWWPTLKKVNDLRQYKSKIYEQEKSSSLKFTTSNKV